VYPYSNCWTLVHFSEFLENFEFFNSRIFFKNILIFPRAYYRPLAKADDFTDLILRAQEKKGQSDEGVSGRRAKNGATP
jgi:hypothetical protein